MEAAGGSQYRVRVVDRCSCNGTFINEEPVLESGPGVVLANNDILRFGRRQVGELLAYRPTPTHAHTRQKRRSQRAALPMFTRVLWARTMKSTELSN